MATCSKGRGSTEAHTQAQCQGSRGTGRQQGISVSPSVHRGKVPEGLFDVAPGQILCLCMNLHLSHVAEDWLDVQTRRRSWRKTHDLRPQCASQTGISPLCFLQLA